MRFFQLSLTFSRWAKHHVKTARILIVMAHLLLTLLAIGYGVFLFQINIALSPWIFWIAMTVFIVAAMNYPNDTTNDKTRDYIIRKRCDLLLVASTFFMLLQQSNQLNEGSSFQVLKQVSKQAYGSMPAKPSGDAIVEENASLKPPVPLTWREKLQLKKALVRNYFQQDKEYDTGEKVLYTLLGVVGAVALLFLVMVLACNLSCSGAEGLATMVAIVGTSGIIFLLALLFKQLYGKKKTSVSNSATT